MCFYDGVCGTSVHTFVQWHHKKAEETDDGAGVCPVTKGRAVQWSYLSPSDCWDFSTSKTLIQLPVNMCMDGIYFIRHIEVDSSLFLMNEKRTP